MLNKVSLPQVNNGTQTEVAALYNTTSNTFTPYTS